MKTYFRYSRAAGRAARRSVALAVAVCVSQATDLPFFAFELPSAAAGSVFDSCPEADASGEVCGDATCSGTSASDALRIVASDASRALKAATGLRYCARCRCDTDDSGVITATDAARILRVSVGQPLPLTCPRCNGLEIEPASEPALIELPNAFSYLTFELVRSGGHLTLLHNELDRITMRSLDPQLEAVGEPTTLVEASETTRLTNLISCGGSGGEIGVTWADRLDFDSVPDGEYEDVANVRALFPVDSIADLFVPHDNRTGSQVPVGVACLSKSRIVTIERQTWHSDHYSTEMLGVYARALNVHTGELGPEVQVRAAGQDADSASFVARGDANGFLVSHVVSGAGLQVVRITVR